MKWKLFFFKIRCRKIASENECNEIMSGITVAGHTDRTTNIVLLNLFKVLVESLLGR